RIFGKLSKSNDAMPVGATLPFILVVLPRLFRRHRQRGHGRAARRVMEVGVLADKSDDRKLIHIHGVFSLKLAFFCPNVFWGTQGRTAPLLKRRECFVGGTDFYLSRYSSRGNQQSRTDGVPGARVEVKPCPRSRGR